MKKLFTIILILSSVFVFGQAKQTINVGTSANAGNGDKLRPAFQKINTNFTTLFNNSVMDSTFTANGIMKRTGYGTYTVVADSSENWNEAVEAIADTVTLTQAIADIVQIDDVYPTSVTTGSGDAAPSFTTYNAGGGALKAYEFPGASTMKEMHFGFQFPHTYKAGSTITPHIHLYVPDDGTGGVIKFALEYTWTNINSTGAISPQTVYGTITRGTDAGIANNAILTFTAIAGTDMTYSSILMVRLSRTPTGDDTFDASVWLKSADIHIYKDKLGSTE